MRRDRVLDLLMRLGFFFVAFNCVGILFEWFRYNGVMREASDVLAILGGVRNYHLFHETPKESKLTTSQVGIVRARRIGGALGKKKTRAERQLQILRLHPARAGLRSG
jgi:hypothetical protein